MDEKKIDVEFWRTADEAKMRDTEAPHPRTIEDLDVVVEALANREHDYGTCVYAMSVAAVAAFNYIAHKLGVTGFQASCADMDIITRTRGYKMGFRIIDNSQLLYPQYDEHLRVSPESMLANKDTRAAVAKKAAELLAEQGEHAHPDVVAHWKKLVAMEA